MALSLSNIVRTVTFAFFTGLLALPRLAIAQEETWTQTNTIPIPGLQSFDISFIELVNAMYLLADRSNQQIVNYNIKASTLEDPYKGAFVGAVKTSTGTVNNDISGPNGVISFFNPDSGVYEVWAGDGPQANAGCQAYLGGICSAVKIFNLVTSGPTNPPKAVVATGGAARADELCHDFNDKVVLIANDAEADFAFGTPFVTFISTSTYQIVGSLQLPFATNGIEQCQYDPVAGLFFLNIFRK